MDNIAEMITLQEVDGRLDTIKKRLKEVEALLGRPPFLDALRGEVDAQKGLLKEATGDRKEKEVEAEASRLKITAEEEKLYSGAITESRELRSLQEEIFALRRGLKAQEESGLAQLEREELDREARDYLVRLLKRVEADWSERESELGDATPRAGRAIRFDRCGSGRAAGLDERGGLGRLRRPPQPQSAGRGRGGGRRLWRLSADAADHDADAGAARGRGGELSCLWTDRLLAVRALP